MLPVSGETSLDHESAARVQFSTAAVIIGVVHLHLPYAQSRPRRPVLTEEGAGALSMRTRIVAFAIVMTVVTLTAAPGFAHHSDVAYDQAKRTTLKDAKVISYAWRNPNGTKFGRLLRVTKADSTVLTWGERNRASQ